MTQALRDQYDTALRAAAAAVTNGDKEIALLAAMVAMRAANSSREARYRRAAFRVLNTVRAI